MIKPRTPGAPVAPPSLPTPVPAEPAAAIEALVEEMVVNPLADWQASAASTLAIAKARLKVLEPEIERLRKVIAALS